MSSHQGLSVPFITALMTSGSDEAMETVSLREIHLQGQEQLPLELVQHNITLDAPSSLRCASPHNVVS